MISTEKLRAPLSQLLESNGVVRHHVRLIPGSLPVLEIQIDNESHDVDVDFCEQISRLISDLLDELDSDDDSYMLDVCSFGAERELTDDTDIRDNVGSYIHVELRDPKAGMDTVEGTLEKFEDGILTIEYKDKNISRKANVERNNIKLIRLAVRL